MRNKRGITLVSLVVTIIVLIILAGVSINLTLGENGLITMAKKARENMELAQIEEQTNLNDLYEQIVEEGGVSGNLSNEEISQLSEFKRKIASAITDMGIETLETANADTMASNIRNISISKDASAISYDNTNSELISTNVQGAVDELDSNLNEVVDISNLITPASGITLRTISAQKIGKDVFINLGVSWSGNANSKLLVTIDESILPITPIISNLHVYTGGNYYMGTCYRDGQNIYGYISTSTDVINVNMHWKVN